VPDNVLFEGGAGEVVRRKLLQECDVHTLLRLPTGIFYAQGVKTNVLFFARGKTDKGNTKEVWVYDLRANMPSFGKRTPFTGQYLQPFEACFHAKPREEQHGQITLSLDGRGERETETRWRCFSRDWIKTQKADSLDIAWLKDQDSLDAASLPEPDVLAAEAMSELTEALRELNGLMQALEAGD
jgi:type I restriction enzyme M protein